MGGSIEITIDAVEVDAAVAFWTAALGYEVERARPPYVTLTPPSGDPRPRVLIQEVDEVVDAKSPVHLDLRVEDPDAEVRRLRDLGATIRWEVDETSEGGSRWTTMADPSGNEFCVCPRREG